MVRVDANASTPWEEGSYTAQALSGLCRVLWDPWLLWVNWWETRLQQRVPGTRTRGQTAQLSAAWGTISCWLKFHGLRQCNSIINEVVSSWSLRCSWEFQVFLVHFHQNKKGQIGNDHHKHQQLLSIDGTDTETAGYTFLRSFPWWIEHTVAHRNGIVSLSEKAIGSILIWMTKTCLWDRTTPKPVNLLPLAFHA